MHTQNVDSGEAFRDLGTYFKSGTTRPLKFRLHALSQLEKMIRENQARICEALFADLHKPKQEALISEIAVTLEEILVTRRNLRKWMKPKTASAPLGMWPSRSYIYPEPLGVILIIGPWNYPFQLMIAPLVGAIAAGNCAVIKPSELTPHTSRIISDLIQKYFSADYLRVIEGGIAETTSLLSLKFDHIFFTGSSPVGKIVMQAAAKNLVPVTLELGGKSPAIVCEDADLDLAARRIVWGKFYNAGQTCVAPDYLYVQDSIIAPLLEKIRENIKIQFGENAKDSQSYSRIVNLRNFQRLSGMIDSKKIFVGGESDAQSLYIQPTVLQDVEWDDRVMQEEIFGPILPVLAFKSLTEVFGAVNLRPKPLAAYMFSSSAKYQSAFIQGISFGGGCINDVVVHLSNPYLPFGGVGESGMGCYHGKNSFKTFSHSKSVMHRYGILDLSARYAPYTEKKVRLLRYFFRF
jgi:aldehyde dehydrogenase (NAD+)